MRNIFRIIVVGFFSIAALAQGDSGEQQNKIHPTAIELQAYNRIVAHFTREISAFQDISGSLDELSLEGWKQSWFNENKRYLKFIDDKSKNENLKSKYLKDFVPEIINCYFLFFQCFSLSSEGSDKEDIPEEVDKLLKTDPLLQRLFDDEARTLQITASELELAAQSLKRLKSVLRKTLVDQLKTSTEAVVEKFNKNNQFSKQPIVEVLNEEEYGLAIGTRVIKSENGPFIVRIARVTGIFKVVNFYLWIGD